MGDRHKLHPVATRSPAGSGPAGPEEGGRAQPQGQESDPAAPDNSPQHEQAESAGFEGREGGEEDAAGEEDGGQGGREGASPEAKQLFDLAVGRVLDALSRDGRGLDAALRADPVKGAVKYGTAAVRAVAQGAQQAGKPIPFDILIQVGMQTVKELGSIANEKGYLPDDQIETFLKEAFQQSLADYAQSDMMDGLISPDMVKQVQSKLGGAMPAGQPQQAAGALMQ